MALLPGSMGDVVRPADTAGALALLFVVDGGSLGPSTFNPKKFNGTTALESVTAGPFMYMIWLPILSSFALLLELTTSLLANGKGVCSSSSAVWVGMRRILSPIVASGRPEGIELSEIVTWLAESTDKILRIVLLLEAPAVDRSWVGRE